MKTLFQMAIICLFLSSCQKDTIEKNTLVKDVKHRSTTSVNVELALENGSTLLQNVLKVQCMAQCDSLITVKLFSTLSDSSTYLCRSAKISESSSLLKIITTSPNSQYNNQQYCFATPVSSSSVKLAIQPCNITLYPLEFIGEDQDSF